MRRPLVRITGMLLRRAARLVHAAEHRDEPNNSTVRRLNRFLLSRIRCR